jgi:hypothetical protein
VNENEKKRKKKKKSGDCTHLAYGVGRHVDFDGHEMLMAGMCWAGWRLVLGV